MKHFIALLILLLLSVGLLSCNNLLSGPEEQVINIHYKYDFRDEVNTFNHTLTKDLYSKGTITIDYYFSHQEQGKIIEKALDINFFNLPDSLIWTEVDLIKCQLEPDPGIQYLRIRYNNQDKTVYWYLINSIPGEYKKLKELTSVIRNIIETNYRYKLLPDREGGMI